MRFSEINISEAVLRGSSASSWKDYLKKLIVSTNIGIGEHGEKASGLELTPQSKDDLKDFIDKIGDGEPTGEQVSTLREFPVTFTDGSTTQLKAIHKSEELKTSSAETGKEKKPWNDGEIAETFLGAALYARFISKKPITVDDVWKALKIFDNNPIPGGFEAKGKRGKSVIDMTAINKPMNNKAIYDLVNNREDLEKRLPKSTKELVNKIKSAAAYVNESDKVKKALAEADEKPGAPIKIITDGVGDQKGTKADLQIQIGKWQQLLSLKVNDIKQFGQNSGSSGEIVSEFFQRFIPDLDLSDLYMQGGKPIPWTPESEQGWPDVDSVKATNKLKAAGLWDAAVNQIFRLTGEAYKKAALHLQNKLSTPDGASEVVTDFYHGILHHVQGNAQFQTLVILDPSAKVAWKELEFGPELEAALRNYKLTVDVDIAPGRGSNHKLKVFGTPVTPEARIAAHSKIKTTKSAEKALKKAAVGDAPAVAGKALLFQLRSYIQSAGNMRNPVEMGSLLKDLTEVQKIVDLPEPSTVEKDPEFNTEPTTTPEPQDQQTVAQDQYAAPQVDQTQQTQPAVPPAPTGMPGQMTSIAPAGQTVVSPDNYYNQQNYNTQDLNRMRKNAGIVVE